MTDQRLKDDSSWKQSTVELANANYRISLGEIVIVTWFKLHQGAKFHALVYCPGHIANQTHTRNAPGQYLNNTFFKFQICKPSYCDPPPPLNRSSLKFSFGFNLK